MIWAELGVGVGVALMAFGAGVLAGIIIAEWRLAALPKGATPQAEQKGLALLRLWLSPEQAEQFSCYRHFDVIGSDTGSRYRIRPGRMMNVEQLDSAGNKVFAWCFLPVGNLASGDCMLAQKIALETFESNALAIANRSNEFSLRAARSQPQPVR
jgi:hypothetical protein